MRGFERGAVATAKSSIKEQINAIEEKERVACMEAIKIARELTASREEAGTALNEMKLKTVHCRLGRFS